MGYGIYAIHEAGEVGDVFHYFSVVNIFIDLVKHRAYSYRAISDTFIRYVTIKISHFLMKST